ncbi:MAG: alkaline phosphatase family protein [Candidatus Krumholzibacteria bacterium]|nr:alkaline phosphatase family protein [Candidatus Krumholzibacteria bacterium]
MLHISVDGLRPDAVTALGPGGAPNLYRLRVEGSRTDNARTDYDYTNTLPNHSCMLTGRGVLGPDGHGVDFNDDPDTTLAAVHGSYVAGVFDVVHDHGLGTALYAGKSKFAFFDRSWDAVNGAPDLAGVDDGRDKIDRYLYLYDTAALVDSAIAGLLAGDIHYLFLHLRDPDTAGHAAGWMSAGYLASVARVDSLVGLLLDAIEGDPALAGATSVILTSDHGGYGLGHSDPALPCDFTVPVYVWGAGAAPRIDLYHLNPVSRENPGLSRPDYAASPPPIRNGGTSNLALALLGLPPIPGSTINAAQDLVVGPLADAGMIAGWDEPVRLFPNPSEGRTTVSFSLGAGGPVDILLFDAAGRVVERMRYGYLGRGAHEIAVGGGDLCPGIYFYAVRAPAATSTGKLVLIR